MKENFQLVTDMVPKGDQPKAIEKLCANLEAGVSDQVLLGVTGSGKTFTVANVVARLNRPTLVMAPNKTLAAQLYSEFKELFPNNAVEYFVSYYDYYQPEAYLPHSDTYIEKDSSINEDIDKLRHAATHALLTRRDVLIVASVSCIYGLGSPEYYEKMVVPVHVGQNLAMDQLMSRLVEIQYERNDYDFHRGTFRVRGDVLELIPAYRHERALRIEFFGDEIDALYETDPLTGEVLGPQEKALIFPGSHYVSDQENLKRAIDDIRDELRARLTWYREENRLVEAQRLEQRTQLDLEMIEELGYCNGIENYSRHLDGRAPESPPSCLLDYFPSDFLLFLDESHVSVPQIGGMFNGDRSRKQTLVDFGFRLPSALDNRPLSFDEFLKRLNQTVYVSATPGNWERDRASGEIIEQVIRPTGLLDPQVEVRPTGGQMDDLLAECRQRMDKDERVLITTLTKRLAEDLTEFLHSRGVPSRYMHSDIDTLERVEIIQSLRRGDFHALVGINLLREGLDLPEVSLVAVLDADKEGFLRSARSLIQTFGRAARNRNGCVLLYADKKTPAMREAMDESHRRRSLQEAFNLEHGITPESIRKRSGHALAHAGKEQSEMAKAAETTSSYGSDPQKLEKAIARLEREMRQAAKDLAFERAASLRDEAQRLRQTLVEMG
ncbi:excinuclease ABC subunit UvrB [Desulfohalobium retbaense]|uniref:UvrABC system protein B n=1 Tax=Desulfohalobium retbaense (strain ATCC 49708 / DSM 5692 / JCM 16813 / HR100) TaxID=485915 RepID=C8X0Z3_DESRD|nr:excinuclease ABC subunit UvrB [Desulfohalobium retbaense]ACV68090.1 excinuclease ABC, B subunit [Desulfohalobium retbaense DSM 5692]